MEINYAGLATPWPIALVSVIISFINLKRVESFHSRNQSISFDWLFWIITIVSFIRCLVSLVGSINSLRVYGLSGFQYPGLACLIPFNISASLWQLKLFRRSRQTGDDIESLEGNERKIKFLRKINVFLTMLTVLWTIISLGIYASRHNFASSAWYTASCKSLPTPSSHTIIQCTPQGDRFNCLVGSRDLWIIDLFVRSVFILCSINLFCDELELEENENEERINVEIFNVKNMNFVLTLLIFLSLVTIQMVGIDVGGLESACGLNGILFNSYTGYLQEWWQQEMVALKQIALV